MLTVLLGKLGDQINILPLLKDDADKGQRNQFMVAKEYAPILDGVPYCDPIAFDGAPHEIARAMTLAKTLSKEVRCLQVAGPDNEVLAHAFQPAGMEHALTDSFAKEPYRIAGRMDLWREHPPIVFQRNNLREAALVRMWIRNRKKVILVHAGGKSSPFPYKDLLFGLVTLAFKDHHIVDLEQVKAERLYDLLGLYERATLLISSDSAPLHLARAVDIPIVALVNDKPSLWHGSPWQKNHIFHCRYSGFPARAMDMLNAMRSLSDADSYFAKTTGLNPRVIHVWSQYHIQGTEAQARHIRARESWLPYWCSTPIEVGACGRDSAGPAVKDRVRYPFLRDVLNIAAQRAQPDELILLTAPDTITAPELMRNTPKDNKPFYAHRRICKDGQYKWHPSVDLFGFTKRWWLEVRESCPDLIMGRDIHWHRVLLDLVRKSGGVELKQAIARNEVHAISTTRSAHTQYNEDKAKAWRNGQGPFALYPPVAKQLTSYEINRHALFPFGYNPSIIEYQGRTLMAYRWHKDNNLSTQLAMAELDAKFNVRMNRPIIVAGKSCEDPKLFIWKGQLWMTYVVSTWPEQPPKAVVRYGRLVEEHNQWQVVDIDQPKIGSNDGSAVEKNFVPIVHNDALWFIYGIEGNSQIVAQATRTNTEPFPTPQERGYYPSPALTWEWGTPRGGTPPIPHKGKLLRFFHSGVDFEPPPNFRRYFIGAMLLENEPPFAPIAMSKEPILCASEIDNMSESERSASVAYKTRVCFPGGVIERDGHWLLSIGINDSHCLLSQITEKDLKLT